MLRGAEINFVEIRNGNHLAFKELFDATYTELVIYAHSYLYEKSSSEDIVQEVFVRLWERSHKITIDINLKSYLFAMVRNACLNHLKKFNISDQSKVLEIPAVAEVGMDMELAGEDHKQLLYNQVLKVIDELPTKMKAVVELRFQSDYAYQEIADELNISVNTVKTQLRRAKAKFSELILTMLLFLWY
ncbi:RNA polymerase sigma factor [Pseudozobellia sp. WGM2]|uniref:RNA polymerase sigma factor n=1 Tax=Pseudozobellia sp. WGM2 TaxID=2787625 RepID=UPI001ADF1092|nr:RNA polymerase sigma-70 factor [Pseudozobellia sp. WGM2]